METRGEEESRALRPSTQRSSPCLRAFDKTPEDARLRGQKERIFFPPSAFRPLREATLCIIPRISNRVRYSKILTYSHRKVNKYFHLMYEFCKLLDYYL